MKLIIDYVGKRKKPRIVVPLKKDDTFGVSFFPTKHKLHVHDVILEKREIVTGVSYYPNLEELVVYVGSL